MRKLNIKVFFENIGREFCQIKVYTVIEMNEISKGKICSERVVDNIYRVLVTFLFDDLLNEGRDNLRRVMEEWISRAPTLATP